MEHCDILCHLKKHAIHVNILERIQYLDSLVVSDVHYFLDTSPFQSRT